MVIYKLSLITLAAVLGYWLDRSLFPKARPGQYLLHDKKLMAEGRYPVQTGRHLVFAAALIRRALIVAAVCLAVATGGCNHELASDYIHCSDCFWSGRDRH